MARRLRLTARQVNLLLEALVVIALLTGLVSWIVPLSSARLLTAAHAVAGLMIVAVMPLKLRGSVKAGFRRKRATRWLSAGFGILVLIAIALGLAHATGIWVGVGYWTSLWTHQLIGFVLIPLLVWHVLSRPIRPSMVDIDRRGLLTTGAATAAVLGTIAVQESVVGLAGLAGGDRDGTGSHETGSFDPMAMPAVQWINDTAPADTAAQRWPLTVVDQTLDVVRLGALARPLVARLDCTGGWYADQNWDVVPISELLPDGVGGRSFIVSSATGYRRLFPLADAAKTYLAIGYDGQPLRPGHGAPVRVVAPNRRGPQWVKWVVDVSISTRPSWAQLPLPPT